ncbi:kunitz-type serine protease inhibitor homolog delta-dendrotoxin [Manduca sexta]|uniref:kunitz-type serine protease inhibitor homolog delta-dendrotoxin n=1 Tax=Manduca sexta TaxID=7130 RepID=UPI001182625A|nr:kunitz-type serine protease inhibitor homolog delta-dendrotoxin [Manduca sexta]
MNKIFICLFLLGVVVASTMGASDCTLPLRKGPCQGRYHSYYFDVKSRQCKPFVYSGCGGNGNRFYSIDECEFACHYFMTLP